MVLILSSVSLCGQNDSHVSLKNTPIYEGEIGRQVAILEIDYPEIAAGFSTVFPAASNPLWLKEGNSLYVYFLNMDKKVTAVFSDKGRMSYSIAVLNLADIPEFFIHKIKKEYPFFSFFSGKQIQAGGYTAYELIIENGNEFIALSTTDENEIVVTGRMRKRAKV